jgi:hypothetical protein
MSTVSYKPRYMVSFDFMYIVMYRGLHFFVQRRRRSVSKLLYVQSPYLKLQLVSDPKLRTRESKIYEKTPPRNPAKTYNLLVILQISIYARLLQVPQHHIKLGKTSMHC